MLCTGVARRDHEDEPTWVTVDIDDSYGNVRNDHILYEFQEVIVD